MKPFAPNWAYFEPIVRNYLLGQDLYDNLQAMSVPIILRRQWKNEFRQQLKGFKQRLSHRVYYCANFYSRDWQNDYYDLLKTLADALPAVDHHITFEFIMHHFK